MPTLLPPNAAGTIMADGTVISGDDSPRWRAAGFDVESSRVQCSARIAAGADRMAELAVRLAVDCNGAPLAHVRAIVARVADVHCALPAVGAFDGSVVHACLLALPARDVIAAHRALARELPGFHCAAVLSAL